MYILCNRDQYQDNRVVEAQRLHVKATVLGFDSHSGDDGLFYFHFLHCSITQHATPRKTVRRELSVLTLPSVPRLLQFLL